MRELPQSIQPDGIYQTNDVADFWMMSKPARQAWYRVLNTQFSGNAAKVGAHFVLSGSTALASLVLIATHDPESPEP